VCCSGMVSMTRCVAKMSRTDIFVLKFRVTQVFRVFCVSDSRASTRKLDKIWKTGKC